MTGWILFAVAVGAYLLGRRAERQDVRGRSQLRRARADLARCEALLAAMESPDAPQVVRIPDEMLLTLAMCHRGSPRASA